MNNYLNSHIELTDDFCNSIDELVCSNDFTRFFQLVLDYDGRYDTEYFLGILNKFKNNQNLTNLEKNHFIELLSDSTIESISKKFIGKLKGFTIEEVKDFLENYPVIEVINYLEEKAKKDIFDVLDNSLQVIVEESIELMGNNYFKLYIEKGGKKKMCLKKKGESINEDDFVLDSVGELQEVNGEIYYKAILGSRQGNIKHGEQVDYHEKILFDRVFSVNKIGGDAYYKVSLLGKEGVIKCGDENNFGKKIIFDSVWALNEIDGELFYKAILNGREKYLKFGDEKDLD